MTLLTKTDALTLENVWVQFGGLAALADVSLKIPSFSIFGIIGPNGAGKTTLFNTITGLTQPTKGSVKFFSQDLKGLSCDQVSRLGIARTFQNIRLFASMTVFENLLVAAEQKLPHAQAVAKCEELLEFFHFQSQKDVLGIALAYGDQRRLEIARGLATQGQILLLDEPAAGLNPQETLHLHELIIKIRNHFKRTVILIEHDMKLVMGLCETIAVFDYGKKIACATPAAIQKNPAVIEAYLGYQAEFHH
jgi:branched-chain amino acid transport system ATP-binding protein